MADFMPILTLSPSTYQQEGLLKHDNRMDQQNQAYEAPKEMFP